MMPVCNAHGLDRTWEEPPSERAHEFFDNLSERTIREESNLIRPTTYEEVAYIASRAEEANLATEAGSFGFTKEEADEEEVMLEETLVGQGEVVGQQSGMVAGSSPVEDATEEQLHEEPPAPKKRVLRKAVSGVPAHQPSSSSEVPGKGAAGKAAQRQRAQQQLARCTRRTTAATTGAAGAFHTIVPAAGAAGSYQPTASAVAKRPRTPSPPPCMDTAAKVDFDISAFSLEREE